MKTESDDDIFKLLPFSNQGNLSANFSATASNDATIILVEDQGYLLLSKKIFPTLYICFHHENEWLCQENACDNVRIRTGE